ncbi:MAG: class I SAM-dependent methyltransferase [Halobacteriales archaeon]|nr:class I SAM-dependent methyltransferase [Halobacteriales archaeon]
MTPRSEPFEKHADRYDTWFEEYEYAYESEVNALRELVPPVPDGLSVGVGTGRFAVPLEIGVGVDPSVEMLRHARRRGVESVRGVGEALPFEDGAFDTVLVVTTVCFVDDLGKALQEARRVLSDDGVIVIGYVDADSPLGRRYERRKDENPFYTEATFVTTEELDNELRRAGFVDTKHVQTLFRMPEEMEGPDQVQTGYGDGSFVGLRARAGDDA